MKKRVVLTIITALLAAGAMFLFSGCGKKTIDLNKYLTVSFDGIDTAGKASYDFDKSQMMEDYDDIFQARSSMGHLQFEMNNKYHIRGKLSKAEGLSNGDTVTFHWDTDLKDLERNYKVQFTFSDADFTVSGLTEGTPYDPFDDVTVEFSGIAPYVTVECTYDGPLSVSLISGGSYYKNNGDTFTITLNGYREAEAIEKGLLVTTLEKEYTVEGQTAYVSSTDQLTQDFIDEIDREIQRRFTERVNETWNNPSSLKSVDYIGNYFYSGRGVLSSPNYLYLVYKVTVDDAVDPFSYYIWGVMESTVIAPDGTLVYDIADLRIIGDRMLDEYFYRDNKVYYGCEDMESLLEDITTYQQDNDHVENNITE